MFMSSPKLKTVHDKLVKSNLLSFTNVSGEESTMRVLFYVISRSIVLILLAGAYQYIQGVQECFTYFPVNVCGTLLASCRSAVTKEGGELDYWSPMESNFARRNDVRCSPRPNRVHLLCRMQFHMGHIRWRMCRGGLPKIKFISTYTRVSHNHTYIDSSCRVPLLTYN